MCFEKGGEEGEKGRDELGDGIPWIISRQMKVSISNHHCGEA